MEKYFDIRYEFDVPTVHRHIQEHIEKEETFAGTVTEVSDKAVTVSSYLSQSLKFFLNFDENFDILSAA